MRDESYQQYLFDNEFGWQVDRPVFIKLPFFAFGRQWKQGDHFTWDVQAYREEDFKKVRRDIHNLYLSGKIHHDSAREVQQKVGDRLGELDKEGIASLIRQVNAEVKKRCTTDKEFQTKRIKQSKIIDKQRGLIRAWLNRNNWALDIYTDIRDDLLEKANSKSLVEEPTEHTTE